MSRPSKVPIWLPYTNVITISKEEVYFEYKGGELTIAWRDILSIMFYGSVCPLEHSFLDVCLRRGIPICIYRRHLAKSVWITGSVMTSKDDILTRQVIFRENKRKSLHIAKKLIHAKCQSMLWCYGHQDMAVFKRIKTVRNVDDLRIVEAVHAKAYWRRYYRQLGFEDSARRTQGDILGGVLDAISKLTSGIVLRWITYHKLSPYHGFLHYPVDYPALVYDLMEPYRGYIEKRVFEVYLSLSPKKRQDKKACTAIITAEIEKLFDRKVYTHQTRQIVTFQELLHGNVLALRAYLLGNAKRFVVPTPGKPIGGRPLQTGYRLYGRSAGPTDFYQEAQRVSHNWELVEYPKK